MPRTEKRRGLRSARTLSPKAKRALDSNFPAALRLRQDLQKWRYRSNLSPVVNQVNRDLGRSVELRHSHVQRLRAGAAADRGLAVIERPFVDHVHLDLNRRTRIVDMQCTQLEMELHSFRDNMLGPIIFRSDIPLMIFQR